MSENPFDYTYKSYSEENDLIVIELDETNKNYGMRPEQRKITELFEYGYIPLDKPVGPTSHEVVSWVRKILSIEKAGHSGTLDPLVTGLLPIGLGEATKALTVLLLGPKEYYGVARLHNNVTKPPIMKIFKEFTTEIFQKPPQKSAVRRQTRRRTIYALDIIEKREKLILFRVLCQAGTYVRKLIYDIGEVLGSGASLIELRRTRVSNISEENGLVRLHDLNDAIQEWREKGNEEKIRKLIHPVEEMVSSLKRMVIRDSAISAICNGAQLAIPGLLKISKNIEEGDTIAIFTLKDEVVAIGEACLSSYKILESQNGIAAKTRRVIMKQDAYPRLWKSKKLENAGVA